MMLFIAFPLERQARARAYNVTDKVYILSCLPFPFWSLFLSVSSISSIIPPPPHFYSIFYNPLKTFWKRFIWSCLGGGVDEERPTVPGLLHGVTLSWWWGWRRTTSCPRSTLRTTVFPELKAHKMSTKNIKFFDSPYRSSLLFISCNLPTLI